MESDAKILEEQQKFKKKIYQENGISKQKIPKSTYNY